MDAETGFPQRPHFIIVAFMTIVPIPAAPPRKAARDVRRAQLIDATIAALARKGFAALTIADVAKEAGLSPGIVIFHFNSKDELLASVLQFLASEYHRQWNSCLRKAGPSAAERIKALYLADFDRQVFTPQVLAAWIAFWGEVQGWPVYDKVCAAFNEERQVVSQAICRDMVAEGGYQLDPHMAMCTLEALADGLWLGLAAEGVASKQTNPPLDATKIMMSALSALFPRHFPPGS
jgi:TetR/AcrR family transcriptional repressor of bet genes